MFQPLKIYYLFSKNERLEAIYACENQDDIGNAKLQTGVYPMGTLLSAAMRVLSPWAKTDFNPFFDHKKKLDGLTIISTSAQASSFSSVVRDDSAARIAFEMLFTNDKDMILPRQYNEHSKLLQIYIDYIGLCQRGKNFASIEKLILLSNTSGHELPRRSIYAANKLDGKSEMSKDDIKQLLTNSDLPIQFFAPDSKKQTQYQILPSSMEKATVTPWQLTTPLVVFDIHDIVDFILASLQCIFEQNYVIGKCSYCGDLLVTHNRKLMYCPKQDLNNKSKLCREHAKLKRQLENEKKENTRLHKSLRTMLSTDKFQNSHSDAYGFTEKYESFLKQSQEYRDKIKIGEATEEEYNVWLKGNYARKYK